jgi:hypothetical protein
MSAIMEEPWTICRKPRPAIPVTLRSLNALGVVYDKLGRFDLSARYYAQARAIDPNSQVVAANVSYSNALQGLTDPNARGTVARLDLPENFNPATGGETGGAGDPPPLTQNSIRAWLRLFR